MKLFFIAVIFLIFWNYPSIGQVAPLSPNHSALYTFTYIPFSDSNEKKTLKMELNIGDGISYLHDPAIRKIDSLINFMSHTSLSTEQLMLNYNELEKPVYKSLIVKQPSISTISFFDIFGKSCYNYIEKLNIKWSLSNETKMISGYTVHKASCNFKGRNYLAWYTLEIPISDGPYKFSGLPGLIVEISDEENIFNFKLNTFKNTIVRLK